MCSVVKPNNLSIYRQEGEIMAVDLPTRAIIATYATNEPQYATRSLLA